MDEKNQTLSCSTLSLIETGSLPSHSLFNINRRHRSLLMTTIPLRHLQQPTFFLQHNRLRHTIEERKTCAFRWQFCHSHCLNCLTPRISPSFFLLILVTGSLSSIPSRLSVCLSVSFVSWQVRFYSHNSEIHIRRSVIDRQIEEDRRPVPQKTKKPKHFFRNASWRFVYLLLTNDTFSHTFAFPFPSLNFPFLPVYLPSVSLLFDPRCLFCGPFSSHFLFSLWSERDRQKGATASHSSWFLSSSCECSLTRTHFSFSVTDTRQPLSFKWKRDSCPPPSHPCVHESREFMMLPFDYTLHYSVKFSFLLISSSFPWCFPCCIWWLLTLFSVSLDWHYAHIIFLHLISHPLLSYVSSVVGLVIIYIPSGFSMGKLLIEFVLVQQLFLSSRTLKLRRSLESLHWGWEEVEMNIIPLTSSLQSSSDDICLFISSV